MASDPLRPPEVPVLPRTVLEEHILARLLYAHAVLPARSTDAPPTTFTADTRYDIYAAITTLARAGQRPTSERAAAELSRRIDWTPEWALPAYGGHGAPWASTYLHRLAMTEPTTFTLQRLVASDAAARHTSNSSRPATTEAQCPLPTTGSRRNPHRADVPQHGPPSPPERLPPSQHRPGPAPRQ
jgi:hypothetical protein